LAYNALRSKVYNRGKPPITFLDTLISWGAHKPESMFAPNAAHDIYASVSSVLGPWQNNLHRRAVMIEVMRVLAGFESSWDWNAGVDVSNPTSITPTTIEAGAWQVSANSMDISPELKAMVVGRIGTTDGNAFQAAMKSDHDLAMDYVAVLLRHTVNHHGPVKHHKIDPWLRKDAVAETLALLPSWPA
jgi:hypothetical protein